MIIIRLLIFSLTMVLGGYVYAATRVAVANLAFKETVKDFFFFEASSTRANEKSSSSRAAAVTHSEMAAASRSKTESSFSNDYVKTFGTVTRIERKELLNFTADIKGALINSGYFQVQAVRPYSGNDEKLYDVVKRIKEGGFPGADYVLFGVVSSLEWRNEGQPVPGTSTNMWFYGLDLGVEFSLINTRTFEVKSSFTALGQGEDNKVFTTHTPPTPSKARVMQGVSRSLAEEVSMHMIQQFDSRDSISASGYKTRNASKPAIGSGAVSIDPESAREFR